MINLIRSNVCQPSEYEISIQVDIVPLRLWSFFISSSKKLVILYSKRMFGPKQVYDAKAFHLNVHCKSNGCKILFDGKMQICDGAFVILRQVLDFLLCSLEVTLTVMAVEGRAVCLTFSVVSTCYSIKFVLCRHLPYLLYTFRKLFCIFNSE